MFISRLVSPALLVFAFILVAGRLTAQNVALGRFDHEDYERNDATSSAIILDQLIVRLGSGTPCSFVERAEIERVIREKSLLGGGMANADNISQISKLLPVDLLLSGTFTSPAGRAPAILLEVVEPSRAETVASARIELAPFLQRGGMAALSEPNLKAVALAAGPLLAEGWREVRARSGQILIKPLAFINRTGNADWDHLGSVIESALISQAKAIPSKKVLRTHRAELATQESELRLLGLVAANPESWNQLADYYFWGAFEATPSGPVLNLSLWNGLAAPRILTYSLPANRIETSAFVDGVASELLASATVSSRGARSASADNQRNILADLLAKQGLALAMPFYVRSPIKPEAAPAFSEAIRLTAFAIFLNPSDHKNWVSLSTLRSTEASLYPGTTKGLLRRAAAMEYAFSLPARFLIGPKGEIRPEVTVARNPFDKSPITSLAFEILTQGENFSDVYLGKNLIRLCENLKAEVQIQLEAGAKQLITAAPGQEEAFRTSAEAMLATAFDAQLPPDANARLVTLLWPRLKVSRYVHRAWYPFGDRNPDIENQIRELYLQQGHLAEARQIDVLTAAELAQALAAPPPLNSPGEEAERMARFWADKLKKQGANSPSSSGTQDLVATNRRKAVSARLMAELWLKNQSINPPDPLSQIPALLKGPVSTEIETFSHPLEAYPMSVRAKFATQLLAPDSRVDENGYPSAVLTRLRSKIQAWAAGTPAYLPSSSMRAAIPEKSPDYLNVLVCQGSLYRAAREGDLPSLARLFELGAPVEASGMAFVVAIQTKNWPVIEYLLQRGYDPSAPWPIVEGPVKGNETFGALALHEAVLVGRTGLIDRLLAAGIRFDPKKTLLPTTLEQVIRSGDSMTLRKILAVQRLPSANDNGNTGNYLAAAVRNRDLDTLKALLAAGAAPQRWVGPEGFSTLLGGLLATEAWRQEPDYDAYEENCLTLAARLNWREGVAAMLTAPAFVPDEALTHWPYRFTSDPDTRALLLRASLEYTRTTEPAGIDLFVAIAANDPAAVTSALANSASLNARIRYGYSPLHFAILEKHPAIARLLVEKGAPLDDFDEVGVTPLAHAAASGDVELVRFLAAKGANINLQRGNGNSPLGYAIYSRQEPTALALLDLGASIQPPADRPTADPLFQATVANLATVVDRLLSKGANPRASRGGMSIFFPAARSNNPAMIQRFVDLGCDLSQRSADGRSPLVTAVRWGAAESTAKLLALGLRDPLAADAAVSIHQSMDSQYRPSADELKKLHYTPDYRRCLELLQEKSGQIAASSPAQERIFWDRFLSKSQAEVAEFLRKGGNVNFKGDYMTPLQLTASNARTDFNNPKRNERGEIVRSERGDAGLDDPMLPWVVFLLDHGADPEATANNEPDTAIVHGRQNPQIVRVLLEHKARIDKPTRFSGGPLLDLSIGDQQTPPATVRLLLDHGAKIIDSTRIEFANLRKSQPERIPLLEAVLKPDELRQLNAAR